MKGFIRRIFGKKTENSNPETSWNLTTAQLLKEVIQGKRKSIGARELELARVFEKNEIPAGYRFPKEGDLYESLFDQEVKFMIPRKAPYTDSGKAILFVGERIWIDSQPTDQKPIGVYALPVDYKVLEKRMIPERDRSSNDYDGFYFSITTIELKEKFKFVDSDFMKERYK